MAEITDKQGIPGRIAMKYAVIRAAAAAVSLGALAVSGAQAADYKGATVTVLCPFGAAGGYGLLTTLVSKSLGAHLPGKPTVVAQFMPGGGGIKMANYLYNVAPKDGSVIALLYDNIPTAQLLYKDKGVKFKSEAFVALGSLAAYDPGVIGVRADAPAKSVAEAMKTEVVLGANGRGTNQYIIPNLMNRMLGTKFKVVVGYKGMGTIVAGIERGELQGTLGSYSIWQQMRPTWEKENKVRWLVQMAMERGTALKDVPLMQEVATSQSDKDVIVFITLGRTMAKGLFAPPKAPADRVAMLRAGVMALGKDDAFKAAAKKARVNIEVQPWQRLQKVVQATVSTKPEVVAAAQKLMK
jgi:tripartite-type tricarboxylate transporter receptor subunit TctC